MAIFMRFLDRPARLQAAGRSSSGGKYADKVRFNSCVLPNPMQGKTLSSEGKVATAQTGRMGCIAVKTDRPGNGS